MSGRHGWVALWILAALAVSSAWSDTSGPAFVSPREWKDEHGWVIKRVDAAGRMTLLTYDEQGHVAMVAGMDPASPGDVEWLHCFRYEGDTLVSEVDCLGREHALGADRILDVRKGTALSDHKHVSNKVNP